MGLLQMHMPRDAAGISRLSLPLVQERRTVGRECSRAAPKPVPDLPSRPCACLSPADAFLMRPLIFPLIVRLENLRLDCYTPPEIDVPSITTRLPPSYMTDASSSLLLLLLLLLPIRRLQQRYILCRLVRHHPMSLISSVSSPRSNDRMCGLPACLSPRCGTAIFTLSIG